MVWMPHIQYNPNCHHGGTRIYSKKVINIFGNRCADSCYTGGYGYGFGFDGKGFLGALGLGLGVGLGQSLFGGLMSWFSGGSFWAGTGLGNNGGYAGAGTGYFPGAGNGVYGYNPYGAGNGIYGAGQNNGAGCSCGCNGSTRSILGRYSTTTTPPADNVEDPESKEKGKDPKTPPADGEGDSLKTEATTADDLLGGKKFPINPEKIDELLKGGNIQKLIDAAKKDLGNLKKLADNPDFMTALRNSVKGFLITEGAPNGKEAYKFTTDFDKLKQLELLCLLDDKVSVEFAKNENNAVPHKWLHGDIENVKQDKNGNLSFTIDNSEYKDSGEFGLRYDIEENDQSADDNTKTNFDIQNLRDGDNAKAAGYKLNGEINYEFDDDTDSYAHRKGGAAVRGN